MTSTPLWMLNTEGLQGEEDAIPFSDGNFSPSASSPYERHGEKFSTTLRSSFSSTGRSISSTSSYKTKYEPLRSIHEDIQNVFLKPCREVKSRGHQIPEPLFRPSSTGGDRALAGRAVSKGSKRFDAISRNNANVQARPHTSGTRLPHAYSPIRPTERGKLLFSRASSPVTLRHGNVISRDIFGKTYPYPLNNVSYERPSALTHDVQNASVPDGADSILDDSRFVSIAPFIKKEFYNSMSVQQMKELAEKRKRKKIITKTFPNVPAMMCIDYEKRGSPGAVKRQVHRQLFA